MHIAFVPVITRLGPTLKVKLVAVEHPERLVPVTVYEVVTPGAAETVAPVLALNPVEGVQVYVLAPEAVSNVLLPGHMIDDAAETKTVGNVLTVN